MLGGLLIAHPWRQKCVLCEGDIVGSWRVDEETKQFHQKERYCEDCGSRQFKWIPGPHFHFIGYGWTEHTKSIELATGYLIKNIGLLNNVGGAVWYQLTHCGVRAGRQIITYFGVCALRNYKAPKLPRDTKPELCPNCGALMVKTTIAQLSGRPPPWDPQSQNSCS
jgi:ribosomal protein S27AE